MLTAAEVRKIRLDRAKTNHETYKGILEIAYSRIKSRAGQNGTSATYAVPAFVPGRPVYTHSHAVRYVTEKLERGGFKVAQQLPGTLLIDWSRDWAAERRRAERSSHAAAAPTTKQSPDYSPPVVHKKKRAPPQDKKKDIFPSGRGGDLSRKLELLKRSLGG